MTQIELDTFSKCVRNSVRKAIEESVNQFKHVSNCFFTYFVNDLTLFVIFTLLISLHGLCRNVFREVLVKGLPYSM